MAAIHDLIAQVGDQRLRERLAAERVRATRERMFGLVFEDPPARVAAAARGPAPKLDQLFDGVH